ncbi:MAG TPA: tRNA glutamyl-Q(34) synthetase GluQRS [Ktedonobacteraceae bacterium]|jgi:glutamyl-tRNA synthetase
MSDLICGRYAPSPTGALHLGNLRTALLAWLFARCSGGRFILRIEDLDRPRVRPGASEELLADLRWLGLDWDEGPDVGGPAAPYLQSERLGYYEQALQRLSHAGLLYPCYCSRADIARIASAPHGNEGPRYPGTCRGLSQAQRRQREAAGRHPCLRLRVPDECVVGFDDLLVGRSSQQVQQIAGDFILRRADGVVAYQFAVVVDDGLMGINQVVRGSDLLSSTARQILLFEALAFPVPVFAHVPLYLDSAGQRLAKREQSAGLQPLRAGGATPERLVGQLAASCGLAGAGEAISAGQLARRYHGHGRDIMRKTLADAQLPRNRPV